MPRYFKFKNGSGRPVWIHTATVLCLYQEIDGTYNVQCSKSHWTLSKEDFYRLAELLTQDDDTEDDGDWWKRGKSEPPGEEDDG